MAHQGISGLILAAGRGTRLAASARGPKCLIGLRGTCSATWAVHALREAGLEHLAVVVGCGAERVIAHLRKLEGWPDLEFVENRRYMSTDTAYSFWLGAQRVQGPVVLTYADTLIEPSALIRLLAAPAATAMLVDTQKDPARMDMRVTLAGGRVMSLGKDLPAGASHGESACAYKLSDPVRQLLVARVNRDSGKQWFELLLRDCLSQVHVEAVEVESHEWCEIDHPHEVAIAREFVRRHALDLSQTKAECHSP